MHFRSRVIIADFEKFGNIFLSFCEICVMILFIVLPRRRRRNTKSLL